MTADIGHLADLQIQEADLAYEFYNRTQEVREFDCGEAGLNAFLHDPDEVADYQDQGLGATTLVYCKGFLVGFFTLSSDGLELKYVDAKKMKKQFRQRQKEIIKNIPAIKIGRFAVDQSLRRKDIGTFMMRQIVGLALSHNSVAIRLLILEALPESQGFYEKLGFHFTQEVKRERGRRNRTMYFDLEAVRDVA